MLYSCDIFIDILFIVDVIYMRRQRRFYAIIRHNIGDENKRLYLDRTIIATAPHTFTLVKWLKEEEI